MTSTNPIPGLGNAGYTPGSTQFIGGCETPTPSNINITKCPSDQFVTTQAPPANAPPAEPALTPIQRQIAIAQNNIIRAIPNGENLRPLLTEYYSLNPSQHLLPPSRRAMFVASTHELRLLMTDAEASLVRAHTERDPAACREAAHHLERLRFMLRMTEEFLNPPRTHTAPNP